MHQIDHLYTDNLINQKHDSARSLIMQSALLQFIKKFYKEHIF